MAQAQTSDTQNDRVANTDHRHANTPHPSKKVVEESYDRMAEKYLEWTSSFPSPRLTYLHKLLPLLPTSPSILELGCGAGVPCTQVLSQHGDVVAVDISAAQLEMAKENVKRMRGEGGGGRKGEVDVEFMKSDMVDLRFEKETFDGVTGFYSLIHLPREEQVVLIERIGGWLKMGGLLLVNLGVGGGGGRMGRGLVGREDVLELLG
jgi:ubiquinone/menaquinone biosynthesis C-methylase UbiE